MESLVFLVVAWVVVGPIVCLFSAARMTRRAARLQTDLTALEYVVTRLKAELEALTKSTQPAGPSAPPRPHSPERTAAQETVAPPESAGTDALVMKAPALADQAWPSSPVGQPAGLPPVLSPAPAAVFGAAPVPTHGSTPPPAAASGRPFLPKLPAGLKLDWERFMGVKLFAWVGGFALFLGVAFFIKYSFENNLIPPEVRVALGFLAGIGLLAGGVALKRKAYEATSQTLCATGTVILYAVSFACHAYYHFTGPATTFGLMVLVTVTAFFLAVRLNALVVAILGLVGGFLTPPMLSTGVDNPLGLFGYVAILDAGLIAVSLKRRWPFLAAFGAAGTLLMQWGWTHEFFAVDKVWTAFAILASFNLLLLAAFVVGDKLKQRNPWLSGSALALPLATFGYALWLLQYRELGARPGVVFSFLLAADLPVLALVLLNQRFARAQVAAGAAAFLVLMAWTTGHLTKDQIDWALAGYLFFGILHSAFPVVLQRLRPGAAPVWWGHLFPPLALLLVMGPLFKSLDASWLLWPVVLLVDVAAILLALMTGAVMGVLAVLVLTLVVAGIWILQAPAELTGLPPMLFVVGGFAVFFFLAGLFAGEKMMARLEAAARGGEGSADRAPTPSFLGPLGGNIEARAQIPALSAILPFVLLITMATRLPMADPSPAYGLALLMIVLLLGLGRMLRLPLLAPVGLACVLALESCWHAAHFTADAAAIPVMWSVVFTAVFVAYPFVFRQAFAQPVLPWATAALAGPLHFYLIHSAVKQAYPNAFMGLLPVAFAVPMVAALAAIARTWSKEATNRTALLAWFGGSALFFVTLIFPIQFDKQWITIGWALEGAALLWLFHRVPHPGLRGLGVALLTTAFLRLALNPAVFEYHPRSDARLWNWFLYSYGIVTACLFVGAWLLAPPRDRLGRVPMPPLLNTLGTVLAFLLLNIEIADYFSEGATLTFQFSGNFARDMTYSIGWALFALGLLIVGVWRSVRGARYAGLALLVVTLLKLFFRDLTQLSELYRIGAVLGVAVISILASVLYQRFFAGAVERDRVAGQASRPPE